MPGEDHFNEAQGRTKGPVYQTFGWSLPLLSRVGLQNSGIVLYAAQHCLQWQIPFIPDNYYQGEPQGDVVDMPQQNDNDDNTNELGCELTENIFD